MTAEAREESTELAVEKEICPPPITKDILHDLNKARDDMAC